MIILFVHSNKNMVFPGVYPIKISHFKIKDQFKKSDKTVKLQRKERADFMPNDFISTV